MGDGDRVGGSGLAAVPVAILAGGRATRLGPIAAAVPKVMVEVAGRPFVDWQLNLLRGQGVRRVVLCLGHLGDVVARHVGDGRRFGLEVAYAHDGHTALGTAGALRRALPLLGDTFAVLYGDSYTAVDLAAALAALGRSGAPALMTVIRNRGRWDRSNAHYRRGRVVRYDKADPSPDMAHIDYGASLLLRDALAALPPGTFLDLADVFRDLSASGRLAGFPVRRRFYEIGTPAGLASARSFLGRQTRGATGAGV